jgi:hypothetical protein
MSSAANYLPSVNYDRLARYPRGLGPRCRPYGPNKYDDCLDSEYGSWMSFVADGGLCTPCLNTRKRYTSPPWIAMPSEGRRFKPIGTLAVPNLAVPANLNVDLTVMTVVVPKGYNGVITDVVCEIAAPGGTGFVEGSTDIIWRLTASNRYLRDLGKVTTTLGSLVTPNPVPRGGLKVLSDNVLTFTVSFGNNALVTINPNGIVICSITGWFYPR